MQVSDALRMQLHLALGLSLGLTMGPVDREMSALEQSLALAEQLDDWQAQLRALWALWALYLNTGKPGAAAEIVQRFSSVARRADNQDIGLISDRLRGFALHHLGEYRAAQHCLERVLQHRPPAGGREYALLLQLNQRILAGAMLARVLWLQGYLDQAWEQARVTLEEAQATDYNPSICEALRLAVCPLALMAGDLARAEQAVAMLSEIANGLNAGFWNLLARYLNGKLLVMRGQFGSGVALLRAEFEASKATGWAIWHPEFMGVLAEGFAGLGRLTDALATLDEALATAESGGERYYVPELLRVRGELLLRQEPVANIVVARSCFEQAIATAREQGALFWELRAATSLARLMRDQGRSADGLALLQPVYDRFTEGFGTADLKAANALLDALR
jgi:tetratricopeptide (TPR) repeat protein